MGQIESKPISRSQGSEEATAASAQVTREPVASRHESGVFASLKVPTEALGNIFLGEKIAPGVYATFGTGTGQIHVLRTEAPPTIQSLRGSVTKIPEFVERYQALQGFTPSFDAFRLCMLILRLQMGADREGVRKLQKISDEAKAVDLTRPADPKWQREMVCQIGGVPTRLTVSLSRVSRFAQVVTHLVPTDLSHQDRTNRYGIRVSLEKDTERSMFSLAPVRRLIRQVAEVSAMITPMAATFFVAKDSVLADIAAKLSENQFVQGDLIDGMRLGGLAIAGALTFVIRERLQRARLDRSKKGEVTELGRCADK
jgi:hypothetical protein